MDPGDLRYNPLEVDEDFFIPISRRMDFGPNYQARQIPRGFYRRSYGIEPVMEAPPSYKWDSEEQFIEERLRRYIERFAVTEERIRRYSEDPRSYNFSRPRAW